MKWFRMYTDILDDPKIAKMSLKSYQIFTFLLAFCTELDKNGVVDLLKDAPVWRFRMRKSVFTNAIKELESLGVVKLQGENLQILNYNKRQFKSDDVTARVKKHRSKGETLPETLHETPPEQRQNRTEIEIDARDKIFTESLCGYIEKYGTEMVRSFYKYWSEKENGKTKPKMRWELEKTWDLSKRFSTWESNEKKFNPKYKRHDPNRIPADIVPV